jgi:hypothetical protein
MHMIVRNRPSSLLQTLLHRTTVGPGRPDGLETPNLLIAWFVLAMYGYAVPMIALIVTLLLVWLVLVIVGLVVKGLFWLFVVGAILFVATAIVGWIRGRVAGSRARQR